MTLSQRVHPLIISGNVKDIEEFLLDYLQERSGKDTLSRIALEILNSMANCRKATWADRLHFVDTLNNVFITHAEVMRVINPSEFSRVNILRTRAVICKKLVKICEDTIRYNPNGNKVLR